MADFHYLIALALIEQEGQRAMPLGGKSLKASINSDSDLNNVGKDIALELLLRVLQRTDIGGLCRAAGDRSLLLVEMPMELMQERLPSLKTFWLNTGDTDKFLIKLKAFSQGVWALNFVRYEGHRLIRI